MGLRSSIAIVRSTALEILSEPLTLLVLLAALALSVLAPTFHYHQFGDPTRMARDAGFSALFTCGSVIAVFGTIRSFRREIESGTLEMALSHPVSRTGFFLSKAVGSLFAYLGFVTIVFFTTAVMFDGALLGGLAAAQTGDIARIFGPCLVGGVAIIVLPLVIAAVLNRFAGRPFVKSAIFGALLLAAVVKIVMVGLFGLQLLRTVLRLLPVAALLVFPAAVLTSAAASAAVWLRANAAAAVVGVVFLLSVPMIGNYYLADALSRAEGLPWSYVLMAAAVTLPAVVAFLIVGVHLINGRDIQWTT